MGNFFTDTIRTDSRYRNSGRVQDRTLLEPITRKAVLAIIEDAQALGIALMVFETFRSKRPPEAAV
jgi:hypothetical protein